MSETILSARNKLAAKLHEIKIKPRDTHANKCGHNWKRYKQRIIVDNDRYSLGSQPYFVVMGCEKCHQKYMIDMKMGI